MLSYIGREEPAELEFRPSEGSRPVPAGLSERYEGEDNTSEGYPAQLVLPVREGSIWLHVRELKEAGE